MANILEFQPKKEKEEEPIWECSCGSQLFYITLNGPECNDCGIIHEYEQIWEEM